MCQEERSALCNRSNNPRVVAVPMPDHACRKDFYPNIQPKRPLAQFVAISIYLEM